MAINTHHRHFLAEIKLDNNIIIAQANKGLEPRVVDLEQYIKDGLKHILDKETYEITSTEQGQENANNMRLEILDWCVEYAGVVLKHIIKYTKQQVKEVDRDPFETANSSKNCTSHPLSPLAW